MSDILKKCDRCTVRQAYALRYVIAIIYADDETVLDGHHVDDHDITLCPGCLELTRAELMDSVRRVKEVGA